ncbi:MAG: phenylacetate--CoA ligase family protein [Candidatus Zixiibacteriota bacterium]|nr:MAG: phenylacetate--CoA ligase family protein [candidate division Zixibacteria bacterium]
MFDLLPVLPGAFRLYRAAQSWDRPRLEAYQDDMLRRLVRHAGRKVPYYRELFARIGLDPESFRGRADMPRLPLLDKDTVRTRAKDLIAEDAARYGVVWESTSGSTGTPLHVIVDRGARGHKLAALIQCYRWAGYRLGMKTFSLQSYYLKDGPCQVVPLSRVLRYDSVQFKPETAAEAARALRRYRPRFVMGFPFDLLMFARWAAQAGLPLPAPVGIVTYGETLSDHKRHALQEAWGAPVFNYYSQHECASMIAECPGHSLHTIDSFAYHELVDASGAVMEGGGRGELVGTGLYNYAMPLIRYRSRDDVVVDPGPASRCSCGRPYGVVREILGKQCDYLETPDGRLLGAVMSHSIDRGRGVVTSQCVQDAVDHLYVNLVVDASFTGESQQALERDLRKRLGGEMRVDFRLVTELEKRPGGKTPFILSKIGREYR